MEREDVPTEEKIQNPEFTRCQYTHKTLNFLPNANESSNNKKHYWLLKFILFYYYRYFFFLIRVLYV